MSTIFRGALILTNIVGLAGASFAASYLLKSPEEDRGETPAPVHASSADRREEGVVRTASQDQDAVVPVEVPTASIEAMPAYDPQTPRSAAAFGISPVSLYAGSSLQETVPEFPGVDALEPTDAVPTLLLSTDGSSGGPGGDVSFSKQAGGSAGLVAAGGGNASAGSATGGQAAGRGGIQSAAASPSSTGPRGIFEEGAGNGGGVNEFFGVAEQNDVAPVPLPAGAILLLSGLGMVGATRFRKRSA